MSLLPALRCLTVWVSAGRATDFTSANLAGAKHDTVNSAAMATARDYPGGAQSTIVGQQLVNSGRAEWREQFFGYPRTTPRGTNVQMHREHHR